MYEIDEKFHLYSKIRGFIFVEYCDCPISIKAPKVLTNKQSQIVGLDISFCSTHTEIMSPPVPPPGRGISSNSSEEIAHKLVEMAQTAMGNSYSPYSKSRVGSALLSEYGSIHVGTNVENSSYGLTICAERSSCCAAIANGEKKFKAIAVVAE